MHQRTGRRMSLMLGALAVALLALGAIASSAGAASLKRGAVFTETNTSPNYVLAFTRSGNGALHSAGRFATGGKGSPTNPPAGFPTLDSSGPVGLDPSGGCLFAVNAGSNTVSSFRVTAKGLKLANHPSTGGTRPISVTSTTTTKKELLYVLNSSASSASIVGYRVSPTCQLSRIRHSLRPTSSPKGLPAAIRFDIHGKVIAVSERMTNDIDIFPVTANGLTKAPVVSPSAGNTPYGLDWNNRDILSVSNEYFPPPAIANSNVVTYSLKANGKLVKLATAPSPGAACWNVFTKNGKFLYVTNPAGPLFGGSNVVAFKVAQNGSMTAISKQNTTYNAIDDGLSSNDRFLYVLSVQLLPMAGPHSALDGFRVNPATGALTPIGSVPLTGNNTAGIAVS